MGNPLFRWMALACALEEEHLHLLILPGSKQRGPSSPQTVTSRPGLSIRDEVGAVILEAGGLLSRSISWGASGPGLLKLSLRDPNGLFTFLFSCV